MLTNMIYCTGWYIGSKNVHADHRLRFYPSSRVVVCTPLSKTFSSLLDPRAMWPQSKFPPLLLRILVRPTFILHVHSAFMRLYSTLSCFIWYYWCYPLCSARVILWQKFGHLYDGDGLPLYRCWMMSVERLSSVHIMVEIVSQHPVEAFSKQNLYCLILGIEEEEKGE